MKSAGGDGHVTKKKRKKRTADIDIDLTMKAILGMCNMTLIWFDVNGRLSIEEMANQFTTIIFDGLNGFIASLDIYIGGSCSFFTTFYYLLIDVYSSCFGSGVSYIFYYFFY